MPKFFSVLFFILFSFVALAQDLTTHNTSEPTAPIDNSTALLYDQGGAVGSNGVASQQFGDYPTYACQAADDFVVTAGFQWTIESIIGIGSLSSTGGFSTALIEFYANDNGNLPGTLITSQPTAAVVDAAGILTITLSPSVTLTPGTYWVSISVNGDFAIYGQWYWTENSSTNGSNWAWRNPGDGFGTGFTTWTPGAIAQPTMLYDLAFQLNGTEQVVPVELTSFTASANENEVILNWSTATETNNQGFEVQRYVNGEFATIGFIDGHGTTTEVQHYTFLDKNVEVGTYLYRLKQVDFNGTFEYSNIIEAEVLAPVVFALEQNYPNPFNPSTIISYKLAVDSKVSLKVFDVLGQEVATLLNGNFVAGSHTVNFNASSLNSGVYMYRIEATGNDGTNFTSVKKMILTK
jgi:hypothetical protein